MVLKKLKSGMTVYSVKRATGLSSFNNKWNTWWSVYVKEIDEENNKVLASWNGNKEEWYLEQI